MGFKVVMGVVLSCAVFDSLQSAMLSTISHDLFKNELSVLWVRFFLLLVFIRAIAIAPKSSPTPRISLITTNLSCAAVPWILLALLDSMYFIRSIDIVIARVSGKWRREQPQRESGGLGEEECRGVDEWLC